MNGIDGGSSYTAMLNVYKFLCTHHDSVVKSGAPKSNTNQITTMNQCRSLW